MTTEPMSYEDAALAIGCDHHYVRMLTNKGKFTIVERREVRPNVLKVYIDAEEVEAYIESHRTRGKYAVRLTDEEVKKFHAIFGDKQIRGV